MDLSPNDIEKEAIASLIEAVHLDTDGQYERAIDLYKKGSLALLEYLKVSTNEEKNAIIRRKLLQYIVRAESLYEKIQDNEKRKEKFVLREQIETFNDLHEKMNITNKMHEEHRILEDSTGHTYEIIFAKCLNKGARTVIIYDPYIRSSHQLQNLICFCELLVRREKKLLCIKLCTVLDSDNTIREKQVKFFQGLKEQLKNFNIQFETEFGSSLHDREIYFLPGGLVKMGRGLDIFKPLNNGAFSIGFFDQSLRKCKQTVIDVFYNQ